MFLIQLTTLTDEVRSGSEEIEEEHQKLREGLRGQARKRHREASKRVRKKGNGKRRVGREE